MSMRERITRIEEYEKKEDDYDGKEEKYGGYEEWI